MRLADVGFDLELAAHAIDDDLQMQLAHPGDDGLAGLFVRMDAERGVFFRELVERDAHLLLVGLGFRLDRDGDDRLGEFHTLERDDVLLVDEAVTRRDVLEADRSSDVAGAHLFELGAVVRVHLQNTADALALALDGVVDRVARVQDARIDAEERQVTDERIRRDLERERGERRVVGRGPAALGLVLEDTFDRRTIGRRRQVVDDGVEDGLDALVLERRAASHERDLTLETARA